jgi:hypothetical protein
MGYTQEDHEARREDSSDASHCEVASVSARSAVEQLILYPQSQFERASSEYNFLSLSPICALNA